MLQTIKEYEDLFAFLIGRHDPSQKQQHIGLIYLSKDNEQKFLHLAWHQHLHNSIPDPEKYFVANFDVEQIEKIHLATYCALVYEQNKNGISYNFDFDGSTFNDQGLFVKQDPYSGLTCATFVLQVLSSQAYNLLDIKNWISREEDKSWQKKILKSLIQYVPKNYYTNKYLSDILQKIEYGLLRFKPEEVAAAAVLFDGVPKKQQDLQEVSQEIVKEIVDYCC